VTETTRFLLRKGIFKGEALLGFGHKYGHKWAGTELSITPVLSTEPSYYWVYNVE
jgi:hypothetical protein